MPSQPVVILAILFILFCGGWLIARWPSVPPVGRATFGLALVLCVSYVVVNRLSI